MYFSELYEVGKNFKYFKYLPSVKHEKLKHYIFRLACKDFQIDKKLKVLFYIEIQDQVKI